MMSTMWELLTGPVAITLNIALVVILIVRELLRTTQNASAQRLRRLLGLACLPLLALFVVTVAINLGRLSTHSTPAEANTALRSAASAPPSINPQASAVVLPSAAPAKSPTLVPTPAASTTPTPLTPPPAAASAAVEPLDVTLAAWPTNNSSGAQLRYVDNSYRLVLNGQQNVGLTSALPAQEYRMAIDMNSDAGEAGVVFLATEPNTFYRFMINTQGAYALQQVQGNDQAQNMVDWTPNPALHEITTHLRIERHGNRVQFIANGQLLTTFTVTNGAATNQIGVALSSATGQAQATFRNLVVEKLTNVTR